MKHLLLKSGSEGSRAQTTTTTMMWFDVNGKLRDDDVSLSSKSVTVDDDWKMPADNQTAPAGSAVWWSTDPVGESGYCVTEGQQPDASSAWSYSASRKENERAEREKNESFFSKAEDKSHCSLALFSGGCLLGGAGAEDLAPGSLSSCFTASAGASGSFFTSTETRKQE